MACMHASVKVLPTHGLGITYIIYYIVVDSVMGLQELINIRAGSAEDLLSPMYHLCLPGHHKNYMDSVGFLQVNWSYCM